MRFIVIVQGQLVSQLSWRRKHPSVCFLPMVSSVDLEVDFWRLLTSCLESRQQKLILAAMGQHRRAAYEPALESKTPLQ